jgi:DNA-binding CsgD family transcriptional regulator/tetratricopeptide (TPR) repeat protein
MPRMATRVSSPTFIGRRGELEQVDRILERVRAGTPAFLLVAGDAGVGKTRFLREFIARARTSGAHVLSGNCLAVGGDGLPFGPIVEAIRGLTYDLTVAELDAAVADGRDDLARLVPRLANGRSLRPAAQVDPSAQGRLFEHLLLLLERLAETKPTVLTVEDIHWADRSTIDLLRFLARNVRHGRILVVATFRRDELHRRHPLLPFLEERERTGDADRIALEPFDAPELRQQLAAILGSTPDPTLFQRIEARSEGNAFYAEELLAAELHGGRLPDTLRDVLLARVAALDDETQWFIRAASVGGPRFAPATLGRVAGLDAQNVERRLRDALVGSVLVRAPETDEDTYAFRHALLQEAVADDLLPGERTRLHARYAAALTNLGSTANAADAAELAYHLQEAHDLPGAFSAWIQAGLAAESIYAFREAQAAFEHALDLWEVVPDAVDRVPFDRVDLLLRAALDSEGPSPGHSAALVRTAISLVDANVDPVRAGLLQERLGQYAWQAQDIDTMWTARYRAVELVPADPPSAARAKVLSGLGMALSIGSERHTESIAVSQEAVTIARSVGAPEIETRALVPLAYSLTLIGALEQGLAAFDRAREIAEELGDVYEIARTLTLRAGALYEAARLEDAVAAFAVSRLFAERHGLAIRWGIIAATWSVGPLIALGRWDEASAALAWSRRFDLEGINAEMVHQYGVEFGALRGDFDLASRDAAELVRLSSLYADSMARAFGELALWQGRPAEAREITDRGLAIIDQKPDEGVIWSGPTCWIRLRAEADLAARGQSDAGSRTAVVHGVARRIDAIVEDARVRRPNHLALAEAWRTTCQAEASRVGGSPDPDAWAAGVVVWRHLHNPYLEAYCLFREATAAMATGRDRDRAGAALRLAHPIAVRLGARPLREGIESHAARAGVLLTASRGPDPGRGRARSSLTAREAEVLRLLAAGRSNGEIADELFITSKTASVHVANIKAKLGLANRVEIATRAIALGLVDSPEA